MNNNKEGKAITYMNYQNEEIIFYLNCNDTDTDEEYFEKEFDNIELLYEFLDSIDVIEFEKSLIKRGTNKLSWSINACVRDKNMKDDILLGGMDLCPLLPLAEDEIQELYDIIDEFATPNVDLSPSHISYGINKSEIAYEKNHSLDEFIYVCPSCFQTVEKCRCSSYPYYLIQLDRNIYPIIKELNLKGYLTASCCEGHLRKSVHDINIVFKDKYDFKFLPPKGVYLEFGYNLTFAFNGETDKELEQDKMYKLGLLLDWAKELPDLLK